MVQIPTAARDFSIDLRIECSGNRVLAYEAVIGAKLPPSCPERHINSNGSFCVGLDASEIVVDRDTANIWWNLLHNFLKLQQGASRTRVWPPRQELSHGDAGAHHQKALSAARMLGLEDDYYRMLEGEPAWFSQKFPRVHKKEARLCNGRRACPKGCKNKKGSPIPRRECQRKEQIAALVLHERRRRKAEAAFWRTFIKGDSSCCGTMRNCPLRELKAEEQGAMSRKNKSNRKQRTR